MKYEEFFAEVRTKDLQLSFVSPVNPQPFGLSNEALFHLPLIAVTILVLAKSRKKPQSDRLGQLVGECFERTFVRFKGSSQHLGWSANLRVRTVRALTFLEASDLVHLDNKNKRIEITDKGKRVVDAAMSSNTDLAYTLRVMQRSYRNIGAERQIELEL